MDIQKIISYLESRLAETKHRSDLHAHTIQVYNKLLEAAHVSIAEYGKVAGNMFEVLKATELDRHRSLFALYKKLEFPFRMNAHKTVYEAIQSSTSHADILSLKGKALKEVSAGMEIHHTLRNHLIELMNSIIQYMRTSEAHKAQYAHNIRKYWVDFKTLDPALSWDRICTHPPYRNCLYYDDDRLVLMGKTLEEVLHES